MTPCDDCGSIARFIHKLRGCNLYGVVARAIITGLGMGSALADFKKFWCKMALNYADFGHKQRDANTCI